MLKGESARRCQAEEICSFTKTLHQYETKHDNLPHTTILTISANQTLQFLFFLQCFQYRPDDLNDYPGKSFLIVRRRMGLPKFCHFGSPCECCIKLPDSIRYGIIVVGVLNDIVVISDRGKSLACQTQCAISFQYSLLSHAITRKCNT